MTSLKLGDNLSSSFGNLISDTLVLASSLLNFSLSYCWARQFCCTCLSQESFFMFSVDCLDGVCSFRYFFCLLLLIYKHLNNILQSIFPPKKKKKKIQSSLMIWIFGPFLLLQFCFVLVRLSVSNLVLVFNSITQYLPQCQTFNVDVWL